MIQGLFQYNTSIYNPNSQHQFNRTFFKGLPRMLFLSELLQNVKINYAYCLNYVAVDMLLKCTKNILFGPL